MLHSILPMCRLFCCLMLLFVLLNDGLPSSAQYIAGDSGASNFQPSTPNFGGTFYSTPDTIENEVINAPAIRCTDRGVEFSINTRNPFRGNLYVQGEFGLAECRREFYDNDAPAAAIEVRLGDCGMIREKRPHGMSYSLVLITNFHPRFVTRVDRAYKIFCAYQQAERPVGVDLEVGSVQEEAVSSDALMMPDCEYTMRIGDLNGPLATGTVKVGDLIFHRWECQRSDGYGMLVKNCRVFDGGNDNVTLLDERGCPTHSGVVQSPPVYSDGLNMAYAPVFAFHFPDRTQMNFRCQIQTCNKLDNECQGLTPPNCQQNYASAVGMATGGEMVPGGGGYSAPPPTVAGIPYPISSGPMMPTLGPTTFAASDAAVGDPYFQQHQQHRHFLMQQQSMPPPFVGAGIAPVAPSNALPLDSVLRGNPSQVLQGLQRPAWPGSIKSIKQRAEPTRGKAGAATTATTAGAGGGGDQAVAGPPPATTTAAAGRRPTTAGRTQTDEAAAAAAQKGRREQMELEHRILMATQQLKHNVDGSWPPSLVIFGTGNKSAGAGGKEQAFARRFFRPVPTEAGQQQQQERELRQRQRRAEEHTQDVVATSTVVNDGLHSMEWSNEKGKLLLRQVRPRDLVMPSNNNNNSTKLLASHPPETMQCLDRSTLITLISALGVISAIAMALLCHICWDTVVRCRRRCVGRKSCLATKWRSNGVVSSSVDGGSTAIFGIRQKPSAFDVASVFTPHSSPSGSAIGSDPNCNAINTTPISPQQQADKGGQEELVVVPSAQTILAGILNSNLHSSANSVAAQHTARPRQRVSQHQQQQQQQTPIHQQQQKQTPGVTMPKPPVLPKTNAVP